MSQAVSQAVSQALLERQDPLHCRRVRRAYSTVTRGVRVGCVRRLAPQGAGPGDLTLTEPGDLDRINTRLSLGQYSETSAEQEGRGGQVYQKSVDEFAQIRSNQNRV